MTHGREAAIRERDDHLTHLERENARLEKLVADQAAEVAALKRAASGQAELEGNTFVVTASFPIPSVSLQ